MELTEQQMLAGLRAYDQSILGEIYDRLSPELYRYAYRLLGDPHQAEDCVADTFEHLLAAVKKGRGPTDHLRAYLYRSAHNLAAERFRKRRYTQIPLDEWLGDPQAASVEDQAIKQRQAEETRRALWKLTPDQRQVIVLRYYEDWELSEIAEVIGKPHSAVKALQHRAIEALKRFLRQDEREG